jgi:predicted permease
MRRLNDFLFRLKALLAPGKMERELDEEMVFHLEMETRKNVRAGMSEEEARRKARRDFGGLARQKERARESWGVTLARDLVADTRLVFRQFRRNPGFAAAALVTLALGIGANAAIFSIADQALLRQPPVVEPDRLAAVYTTCRRGFERCSSSYPDYEDYRDFSRSFASMAGYSSVPLNVGDETGARLATGQVVTGNYFTLLGLRPHLGRLIQPADDARGAAASVAVLRFDFWKDAFGADPAVVGRTLLLNGSPFTVVGVAPERFRGLDLNFQTDVWIPLFAGPALGDAAGAVSSAAVFDDRGNRWIGTLIGRLAPDATLALARSEMGALARRLGEAYPDERAAVGGVRGITVDPAGGYILPVASDTELKRFIWLLLGVVAFTLLLASANVANLLLGRATARQREIGIRLAVGAGRGRLIRQLLTESLMLGLLGGAVGLAVARVMLELLGAFDLPGGVSIGALGVGLDGRVLLFALALSLATAMVFGVVPALQATRRDLVSSIKGESSERPGGSQQRTRKALVAVQVALCLTLLVGSALFIRTLRNSLSADLGFRPRGVAVARFNPGLLRYGPEQTVSLVNELLERTRGLPGVSDASVSTLVPFQGGGFRGAFAEIAGYQPGPEEEIRFDYVLVEPGYFRALGIPLLDGRAIEDGDAEGARPVAVINRHATERYWPDRSAVGGSLTLAGRIDLDVVGVVDDPAWQRIGEESTPFLFVPLAQYPGMASGGFLTLVARTSGDAESLLPLLREEFRAVEPELSLTTLSTMEDQLGAALMPQRMGTTLLTLFGALALVLAAVGIYGVVGYTVARQAREIGIRIAVGASRMAIVRGVVRGMALPVLLGLALGSIAALVLGRTVESFMFGVDPQDPVTFGVLAAVLLAVALAATLLPARRAAKMDPMRVLSTE